MDFRGYIRSNVLKKTDRILEFGPLIRPLVSKKDYPHIFFADVRSTEDIKKLYTANDYLEATGLDVDIDAVVGIDYVITKSYTETFKNTKKFDVVYLSHVIEHMPDIIDFFKDIANIVSKDGKLVLIYPDAKYCFDHFRNGSTFIDAFDTYRHKTMNAKAVFDFTYNVLHENHPSSFWNMKNVNNLLPKNDFKDALVAYDKALKHELPDDVHFWPFSDYQFVKFLYDMDRAGLLDFEISKFQETEPETQEFMVILTPKKSKEVNHRRYQQILSRISPAIKMNKARQENDELKAKVAELERVVAETQQELEVVYGSRRWQVATKIANATRKVPRIKS